MEFIVGNKVRVTGGTLKGLEGFIVECGELHNYGYELVDRIYKVEVPSRNNNVIEIREGILEHVDGAFFEECMHGINTELANNPLLYKMAVRVPKDLSGNCNIVIAVGARERNIAHFHVFRNEKDYESWKNGACLFLQKNKYYDHSNNTETLTKKELEEVIKILKKKYKRNQNITNWEYVVQSWNDYNELYSIPEDTPMPEYDYNTITRYKEK